MLYCDISAGFRLFLAIWNVILLLAAGFVFARAVIFRQKTLLVFSSISLLLYYILARFYEIGMRQISDTDSSNFGEFFVTTPVWEFVVIETGLTALAVLLMNVRKRHEATHISERSVKESVDRLPEGICVSTMTGLPGLVNAEMDRISRLLTGRPVTDGRAIWELVSSGSPLEGNEIIRGGERPIVRLADGRVYSFTRTVFTAGHTTMYELRVADISTLYDMNTILSEGNKRLENVNKRLRSISDGIREVTIEKEVLDTKIMIHDNMGALLLASRRYLTVPDSGMNKSELLEMWKQNISYLEKEQAEKIDDDYKLLFETAEDVGIRIYVEGRLPEEETAKKIASTAMHECLTNTIRHAEGDELKVVVHEDLDGYTLCFTNNGRQPDGPIRESGGLGSLRHLVEDCGGVMKISSEKEFVLEISIGKTD